MLRTSDEQASRRGQSSLQTETQMPDLKCKIATYVRSVFRNLQFPRLRVRSLRGLLIEERSVCFLWDHEYAG